MLPYLGVRGKHVVAPSHDGNTKTTVDTLEEQPIASLDRPPDSVVQVAAGSEAVRVMEAGPKGFSSQAYGCHDSGYSLEEFHGRHSKIHKSMKKKAR